MKPPRRPWDDFPDVLIHAAESAVKQHPAYRAAKSGDAGAAFVLVQSTFDAALPERLLRLVAGRRPILVSAHAYEREGVNAIPEVLADVLGQTLGCRWTAAWCNPTSLPTPERTDFPGSQDKRPSTARSSPGQTTCWWTISSVWAAHWRTFAGISSPRVAACWQQWF